MANPNIVNVTTIYGKTTAITPPTANATVLVNNLSGSNKVLKINNILATNQSGFAVSATVSLYTNGSVAQGGAPTSGNAFPLVANISIPTTATLIVTDKATGFYLEEANSIIVTSGVANALIFSASYEDIS